MLIDVFVEKLKHKSPKICLIKEKIYKLWLFENVDTLMLGRSFNAAFSIDVRFKCSAINHTNM